MISYFIRSSLSLILYLHRSLVRSTEHVIGKALPGISLSSASCLALWLLKRYSTRERQRLRIIVFFFFRTPKSWFSSFLLFHSFFFWAIVYIFRFHTFKRSGEFFSSARSKKRKMDLLARMKWLHVPRLM